MENCLENLANNLYLQQSELFGNKYSNPQSNAIHTFNELSINNLDDWHNCILLKYNLNTDQIRNFQFLLVALQFVLRTTNPDKLNIKDDFIFDESEFLIWRESSRGISKLLFDKFGDITYVYNGNDGKKIRGVFNNTVDFEKLLYKFLSE